MMAHQAKHKPDAARNLSANFDRMAGKLGVTVPAAWPSGISPLMQAYAACQRCAAQEACTDFLAKAPDSIQLPPKFCPNEAEFTRLNKVTSRG
jgi:hypothetical protein